MSLFSTLRAASWLARDILPALQRLTAAPDDEPDVYADRLAKIRADALAEREAQTEVSEPATHLSCYLSWPHPGFQCVSGPAADCGLGEADECLCDECGGLSCDSCRESSECDCGTCVAIAEDREARASAVDEDRRTCTACGAYPHHLNCPVAGILKPAVGSPLPAPSSADEFAFAKWIVGLDSQMAAVREQLAAIQDHLTSAAPGDTFTPDAAPESPAPDPGAGAGHPVFPDWCAAEMRQVADILLTADSPFRVGYANDLRRAADEHDDDHGSERVSWPWPDENDRRK